MGPPDSDASGVPPPTASSMMPTVPSIPFEGVERTGDEIGPYRLMGEIGVGGFGVVWLAERREPFVQRVALKVIKPGMDSQEVIARFEQERQALAVMNHPNVAKVLDGGVTPARLGSRPYFVMEYVQGEAITSYCDRQRLTIRERLELFIPVCEAVQHAHMKGIIHRDIKPSNVLVGISDRRPVPKVIDFGVAKAVTTSLTARTVFTQQGRLIGTPEYMSPEQAEMGATDVDSRTDVYSLGVLLYQLLTGSLPFSSQTLRSAAFDELMRIIRETEPPRPSTRLSTGDFNEATEIASKRQMQREELTRELRRELEWVPLQAMRKDRTRRYQTALSMADDIRNYLAGRPLESGPESTGYRMRKFIGRHRGPIAAVGAIAATLLIGIGATTWFAVREAAQRRQTEQALDEASRQRAVATAVNDFLNDDLIGAIDPELGSPQTRIIEALDPAAARVGVQFANQPAVAARVLASLARAYISIGAPERAVGLAQQAQAFAARAGESEAMRPVIEPLLAEATWRRADARDAVPLLEKLLADRTAELGGDDPEVLSIDNQLGGALKQSGRLDEAEVVYRRVAAARARVLGRGHRDTLITRYNLALIALERAKALPKDDPSAAELHEVCLREMLAVRDDAVKALGEHDPVTLPMTSEAASLHNRLNRLSEAKLEYQRALAGMGEVLGENHFRTLETKVNLARLHQKESDWPRAAALYEQALDGYRAAHGRAGGHTIFVTERLAEVRELMGKPDLAEHLLERACDDLIAAGVVGERLRRQCERMAGFLERRGEPERAAEWRKKAR